MAKKEKNSGGAAEQQPADVKRDSALRDDEPLFETEAYGSPQPDEGQDVTVLKPVGIGGPVPIVAPKHNTIQLQPIVVPLAVVPYMSQDSEVLRTDGKASGYGADDYAEAIDFSKVHDDAKIRKPSKRAGVQPRVFASITFVLSAAVIIPFILAYFYERIGQGFVLSNINIIGAIINWTKGVAPANQAVEILYIISACLAALSLLAALGAFIFGKYPRFLLCASTALSAGPLLAVLIYELVKQLFVLQNEIAFVTVVALALANFVFSVIFTLVLSIKQRKREEYEDSVI